MLTEIFRFFPKIKETLHYQTNSAIVFKKSEFLDFRPPKKVKKKVKNDLVDTLKFE